MTKTVLLTGISGYISLHCAKELLEAGYIVRGSVRSKAKEEEVLNTLKAASVDTKNLSFVHLDLNSDKGWDEAAKGCTYLMHVASPFVIANPKSEDELIQPAVEGTLRALHAAKKANIERVVLTSSLIAMMGSRKTGTITPDDWTDVEAAGVSTYAKSKTLAEKAAWDFINSQKDDNPMEMVSVHPGGVFGPPLGRDLTGQSMTILNQTLRGKMPMVPKSAFPMVDVRDVALIHLRAMSEPKAKGQRLIAAHSHPQSFQEVAQILVDAGYKGPSTRLAPNFMVKFMALFDREAKGMVGFLDMNISADNSQTRELLNWTPIPFKKSVLDSAEAVTAIQEQA